MDYSKEITENVEVQISILGGTINNNVYGGSNRNDITGTVKIKMVDGLVKGTIYGGSNVTGTVSKYSYMYIYGGTIGTEDTKTTADAIFGGGNGQISNYTRGTIKNYVANSRVVILDKEKDINIYGNIYGGSAWGTVNGNSYVYISDTESDKNTITISNYIFGGGKGSTSNNISASTGGDATVVVDGGEFSNVTAFGGCNDKGTISGNVLVEIGENYKTTLNEVYGAGNQASLDTETDSDYVYLYKNATVTNAFNGGMNAGINGNNTDHPRAIYAIGAKVLESLYGGSNLDGAMQETNVYCMQGATIKNVYGGGYGSGAKVTGNTNIYITSEDGYSKTTISENVFGGGNEASVNQDTNVNITSSIVNGKVYGGGNEAEVKNNTNLNITDSTISKVYGGGNKGKVTSGNTNVSIDTSTINTVFGGGEGETATVTGNTDVELTDSNITKNVYGGGDAGNVDGNTVITLSKSNVTEAVFGGGNQADVSKTTSVTLKDVSNSKNVYGGGNEGTVEKTTSVYISEESNISNNVYGGGCQGKVNGITTVSVSNSTVSNNVYGGGEAANVDGTLVSVNSNSKVANVYGGGDQGEVTSNTRVTIDNAEIGNVYGGGRGATDYTTVRPGKVGTFTTTIIKNSSKITESVFGGGQGITAIVGEDTSVTVENSEIGIDVYGGGDNGFVTGNTSVGITSATINGSAYGAGNGIPAVVKGKSYIYVEGATKIANNLFGGGNAAPTGETETNINNDLTTKNSLPTRKADSVVDIAGAEIGGNVYGGANSSVIYGDVAVNIGIDAINNYYSNISGETEKDYEVGKIYIKDTIYGGGEQMDPTKEFSFKTVSVEGYININIDGNGYDVGDNTIFIGENVFGSGHASRAGLDKAVLEADGISGTVDASTYSDDDAKYNNYVTLNGDVVIKNYGSTQTTSSGTVEKTKNATSLQRCGTVTLDKVNMSLSGTTDSTNVHATVDFSLNQIGLLNIKNGTILYLRHGANLLESFSSTYDDSDGNEQYVTVEITNEITDTDGNVYTYDGEYATKGGTKYIVQSGIIYTILNGGLDEKVSEVDTIKTKTVKADADNRIYMYSGINLDISSDENLDSNKFGPVKGMTFFGIYKTSDDGSSYNKGMFDQDYNLESNINWNDRNYTHCYAQGLHDKDPEQDITKDGFYTNFEQYGVELGLEDEITESNYDSLDATAYTNYITPTPDEANYYMWYAGPDSDIYYFPITLVASKYSTHGAYTLELREINFENATLTINEVNSDLAEGIVLCDKNTIPNINPNTDEADTKFGLTMSTGTNAWSMNGTTEFFADPSAGGDSYSGTSVYTTENSKNTPSLSFYLTHSNNISENAKSNLGYYTINMNLVYYKDALSKAKAKVVIEVALKSKYYDDIGYDAAITPGRQYDVFSKSSTNITTKSCFSTYFELAVEDFKGENSVIREFYTPDEDTTVSSSYNIEAKLNEFFSTNYREITTDYAFPENTTITMIDKSDSDNPEYYYYEVSAEDAANSKKSFKLNEFLKMGSTDEYYDDNMRDSYYNSSDGLDYEYECFLFIVDFESAIFKTTDEEVAVDQTISMSLKSDVTNYDGNKFQITLLDEYINSKAISFGIYNTDSDISIDATLSQNKIYLGTPTDIEITTKYNVESPESNKNITIHDTRYFDKKQGIKLTMYDSEGEIVKGASLLGTYFEITDADGNVEQYYPRTDGTTRIKIAEKVSNSKASITLNTENSSLQAGKYTILIETFASADGVYFGIESADSDIVNLDIVDNMFGLDSSLPSEQVIIDKDTGYTLDEDTGYISDGNNNLNITVSYNSGLTDPYIAVSLYRRDYDNPYDKTYNYVDLSDYVEETLEKVPDELKEAYKYETTEASSSGSTTVKTKNAGYTAFGTTEILSIAPDESVKADLKLNYTLKKNLTTGTYKIVFRLYDINTKTVYDEVEDDDGIIKSVPREVKEYQLIGDTYSYIIIK